jgi:hypothetical protein
MATRSPTTPKSKDDRLLALSLGIQGMEEAFSVAETMHGSNEWYGLDWKLTGLKILSNKTNLAGIGVILQISIKPYFTYSAFREPSTENEYGKLLFW